MKSMFYEAFKISFTVFALLIFIGVILLFWYPPKEAFQIVFGVGYGLFLPGFAWSYALITHRSLSLGERAVLGFGFSFPLLSTAIFFGNALGMKINFRSVIILVAILILLGLLIAIFKRNTTQ